MKGNTLGYHRHALAASGKFLGSPLKIADVPPLTLTCSLEVESRGHTQNVKWSYRNGAPCKKGRVALDDMANWCICN